MKKYLLLSFYFLIFSPFLYAQNKEELEKEAEELYDAQKPREARLAYGRLINLDKNNKEAYNRRGNCYRQLNHLDSAEMDYQAAIGIDPKYPNPHFNLAMCYIDRQQYDQALKKLHDYKALKADDPDVWAQIGAVYIERQKADSAVYYLEKAHALSPENLNIIFSLSQIYAQTQQLETASQMVEKGIKIAEPDDSQLHELAAMIYLDVPNYPKALARIEEAIKRTPAVPRLYSLLSRIELLANTPPELLQKTNNEELVFKDLRSSNLKEMDSWATSPKHPYYFGTLKEKFEKFPQKMGLDEYFMLYYGQALQSQYSPYGFDFDSKLLRSFLDDKKFDECISAGQGLLKKNFCEPQLYFYVALAYFHKQDFVNYREYIGKFRAIMSSILTSGTGKDFDNAYVVIFVRHEYQIIGYLGYNSQAQALHHYKGSAFDVMTVSQEQDEEEKEAPKPTQMYFNIQKSFASLSKIFDKTKETEPEETEKEKKKKDKKNKKKKAKEED